MTPAALNACPHCLHPHVPEHAATCPSCGAALGGPALPAGTVIGRRYHLEHLIGHGGFGLTYRARANTGQTVAIKEYFPPGANRAARRAVTGGTGFHEGLQDFLEEGRTLARFNHPGIVRVHDVIEENGTAYLVMAFVPGEALSAHLARHGRLDGRDVTAHARQAAEALAVVHDAGMLHQDLKPDNLVLTPEGRLVLIDFGAARVYADKTGNYDKVVTPGYAPLEQYGSHVRRGPYTDVYALAATTYALATGAPPPSAVERAHNAALTAPRRTNPTLSAHAERATLWGLEMRADRRPQTALAFLNALNGARPARPAPAAPPAPTTPNLDRVRRALQQLERLREPTPPGLRCPDCRRANLTNRAARRRLCPHCRTGTLHDRADDHPRCPDCRHGRLRPHRGPGLLDRVGLTRRVRCDACQAEWDASALGWRLARATGRVRDQIGATRPAAAWIKLADRRATGFECDACHAELDHADHDLLRLAWTPTANALHDRAFTALEWTKLAHRVPPDRGTHACPTCHAEYDVTPGRMRVVTSPSGRLTAGRERPPDEWTRIAHDLPLPADEARLRAEGETALRDAVERGEWRVPAPAFPRALRAGETPLFSTSARAARKRGGTHEPAEPGTLWITTARTVFHPLKGRGVDIPHATVNAVTADHDAIRLERAGRERPVVLYADAFRATSAARGTTLETRVGAAELARLITNLRGTP